MTKKNKIQKTGCNTYLNMFRKLASFEEFGIP